MPPTQLGPYRILSRIGEGAMGTVYRAAHIDTDEIVAVKLLASSIAQDRGFRQRFRAEVATLRKLDHPHIVRLLGFAEDGPLLFYAMEYVPGSSLDAELKAGRRFSWREVTRMGQTLCQALRHAHDRGVIHRDIKPANLLLTPNDGVKLADFGIARLYGAESMTLTGSPIGTASYMSPEQTEGLPVTQASDLYGLGGVLYAMLAGRPPFVARSLPEMLRLQAQEKPDPVRHHAPQTPPELAVVIGRLLEKKPEDRYATALALQKALQAVEQAVELRGSTLAGGGSDGPVVHDLDASEPVQASAPDPGPQSQSQPADRSARVSVPVPDPDLDADLDPDPDPDATVDFDVTQASVASPSSVRGSDRSGGAAPADNPPGGPGQVPDHDNQGDHDHQAGLTADDHATLASAGPVRDASSFDVTRAMPPDGPEQAESRGDGHSAELSRRLGERRPSSDPHASEGDFADSTPADRADGDSARPSRPVRPAIPLTSEDDVALDEQGASLVDDPEVYELAMEDPQSVASSQATYLTAEQADLLDQEREAESQARRPIVIGFGPVLLALLLVGALVWMLLFLRPPTADVLYERINQAASTGEESSLREARDVIREFRRLYPDDPRLAELETIESEAELLALTSRARVRSRRLGSVRVTSAIEQAVLEALSVAQFDPDQGVRRLQAVISLYGDMAEDPEVGGYITLAKRETARLNERIHSYAADHIVQVRRRLRFASDQVTADPRRALEVASSVLVLYEGKLWANALVEEAIALRDQARALHEPSADPVDARPGPDER